MISYNYYVLPHEKMGFREILPGSIFGAKIMDFTIGFFAQPAGSFLVYGVSIALFTCIMDSIQRWRRARKNRPLTHESLVQEVA